MPNILITGGAGFIGQLLAERLLREPQYNLVLTDIILPPIPPKAAHPQNVKAIQADLCDPTSLTNLINTSLPLDAIYIFHGIMSSGAECNFELGMRVNLTATASLLEALRLAQKPNTPPLRVIYASSQAVYGQPLPETIDENVIPTPEGSYGAQKLICETLVNDYTRKGYLNGFCLRFPTISVRPGKPTQAASSFLSGMVREPLGGVECVIPLRDREFRSWLCSPKTLAENLVCVFSSLFLLVLDVTRAVRISESFPIYIPPSVAHSKYLLLRCFTSCDTSTFPKQIILTLRFFRYLR